MAKAFLETFCETFEPPLENTNFIEVRFELAGEVTDAALRPSRAAALWVAQNRRAAQSASFTRRLIAGSLRPAPIPGRGGNP